MTPDETLRAARAAGLPDEMSSEAWRALERRVRKAQSDEIPPYLGLASVEFDTEAIDGPGVDGGSYTYLLGLIAAGSDGLFEPVGIRDELEEGDRFYRVGFTLGERRYEVKVNNQGDWFQPEVLELVNRALAEGGVARRFHVLPVLDQIAYLVFCTTDSFARLVEEGAIPAMDELLEEEGFDPGDL